MKDIKDRNPAQSGIGDPLADLVRSVEGSSLRSQEPSAPIYGSFEPVEVPQSSWDQFDYRRADGSALAVPARGRMGTPSLDASDRIEALSSPAKAQRTDALASSKTANDADLAIEDALRGLSQPARPRDTIPAETQSFAPARQLELEHEPRQTITLDDFDELIASELEAMQSSPVRADDDDNDYNLDFDEDGAETPHVDYDHYRISRRSRLRLPLVLLGGVATMVLVGVAGAVIYAGVPGANGGGDEPLLIKADAEPYKIAPVDPGGRSIPNQNKAVYQRVAGSMSPPAPTQQSLVTAMEEPVDLAENEDPPIEDLPGVMVGDDLPMPMDQPETAQAQDGAIAAEATASAESTTLQPRKVRTLTVRPDGTLVENMRPADGASALLTEVSNTSAQAALLDPVVGIPPSLPFAADNPELTTASTSPVSAQPTPAEIEPAPAAAEEPEQVAAEPAPAEEPQQTAALEPPKAPALPADGYFVQISSQPSEALANESMTNLGRKFASVIGGRAVGVRAAEIPGKGTFYRVRVAAASKSEANSLCASLKSAGGSCFVTR